MVPGSHPSGAVKGALALKSIRYTQRDDLRRDGREHLQAKQDAILQAFDVLTPGARARTVRGIRLCERPGRAPLGRMGDGAALTLNEHLHSTLSKRQQIVEAAGIEPSSTDATGRASPRSACVNISPRRITQAGAPLASPSLESPVVGTDPPATGQASF
jgi:hypothetical protein